MPGIPIRVSMKIQKRPSALSLYFVGSCRTHYLREAHIIELYANEQFGSLGLVPSNTVRSASRSSFLRCQTFCRIQTRFANIQNATVSLMARLTDASSEFVLHTSCWSCDSRPLQFLIAQRPQTDRKWICQVQALTSTDPHKNSRKTLEIPSAQSSTESIPTNARTNSKSQTDSHNFLPVQLPDLALSLRSETALACASNPS